ncbi:MAG: hypothetical protein COA78_06400 [Blastopirellula sp.]|nr:MAG: hypothetical protein COA78_06400 [Blastopirellula sp.]
MNINPSTRTFRNHRQGTTLIEIVLASALTVVLMMLVGMAIDVQLRSTDVGRTNVEEAQLARAIMRVIESDLQNAVWKNQIDFSIVEELDAGSLGAGDLEGAAEGAGIDVDDFSTDDLVSSVLPPTTVGIYGNSTELQVDISRLPRIDEYTAQYSSIRDLGIEDIPSDVKTVTYFLLSPGMTTMNHGEVGENPDETNQMGLVRRVLDRAVTQWAINNGDVQELDATAEVIAPEVSMLMFRYFDGYQWNDEWDSEELGGLPLAIDVVIAIRPLELTYEEVIESSDQVLEYDAMSNGSNMIYRRLVRIPIAFPIDQEALEEEDLEGEF